MGKRVMSVASAPVARQVRYVVQESYDGTWFDVIPPVSSRAIADDAMGMMAKGVYRIKEV
jgi:hypothetical protein